MASTNGPSKFTMRAQQLHAYNEPYKLATGLPVPVPTEPHDLLIRVEAASYCHTDAVLAAGQMPNLPTHFPHIGSHEFAGTVVGHSANPSPLASSLALGTRLGVPGRAYAACGSCVECTKHAGNSQDDDDAGYSVYCLQAENNGLSRAGGFADYAVVDARQVAPLPAAIGMVDAAPLMCAGVTIYGALKRCGRGDAVGIVGCGGGLGHLGLQMAAKMGCWKHVVGIDAADAPLELARGLLPVVEEEEGVGDVAVRIVDSRVTRAQDVVGESSGGLGLDAVVILPESQAAFDYGMALLRTHGRCVVVSFPEQGFHVSARDLVFRDISVVGSLVGSNKLLRETLDFCAEHNIRAKLRTFPLEQLNELVEVYHRAEGGKLVVDLLRG